MSVLVPVIDLFSGPGGLSEGFLRHGDFDLNSMLSPVLGGLSAKLPRVPLRFQIGLSVEMEPTAHRTLKLRAFFRQFGRGSAPDAYYDLMRGDLDESALYGMFPDEHASADHEAWNKTLGVVDESELDARIEMALKGNQTWVLLGGPPCQAYSLAGRSRNRGVVDYSPEADHRHFLYKQYLRVVARHRPAVFVMENVKGLLSSSVAGQRMFETILDDLRAPGKSLAGEDESLEYDVVPFCAPKSESVLEPADFILKMEEHGIPQARHRVIFLGIRRGDSGVGAVPLLPKREFVCAERVLEDLPRLRSNLSGSVDLDAWLQVMSRIPESDWYSQLAEMGERELAAKIYEATLRVNGPREGVGAEYLRGERHSHYAAEWYFDSKIGGVANHQARSHMEKDLHRYFFAAVFASVKKWSPQLAEFPSKLLPKHKNASRAVKDGSMFSDRFRVQLRGRPSTTVTSHIKKDGHHYIHPEAQQCRSLTVREAARLQTFPDNYFFCGAKTSQYQQVGNAVPPLMAVQLASVVAKILEPSSARR